MSHPSTQDRLWPPQDFNITTLPQTHPCGVSSVSAVTEPLDHSSSFTDPSTSRLSVGRWLEQTPSVSTSLSTPSSVPSTTKRAQETQEEDLQHARKRKRSLSLDDEPSRERRSHPCPLTSQYLKEHLKAVGSQMPSPLRQSTSGQSSAKSSKMAPSYTQLKSYLEQHHMHMGKGLLGKPEHAAFKDLVTTVANTHRSSGIKQQSVDRLQKRLTSIKGQNEATILLKILPCIIKTDSKVSAQDPGTGLVVVTDEDFEDTGLDMTADHEFKKSYMPNAYTEMGFAKEFAEALQKQEGVNNPKPDRIYGLTLEIHPLTEEARIRAVIGELMEIAPTLHHPFYLIEGKSSNRNLNIAQCQACRGGATIVRATREVLEQTGQNDEEEGPDLRTYIYSTTINGEVMKFWVHFALVKLLPDKSKRVIYHMEHLRTIAYADKGNPLILRRICHNIIEWGVRGRARMLEERCAQILKHEEQFHMDQAIKSQEEVVAKKEEARQKRLEASAAKKRKFEEMGAVGYSTSSGTQDGDVFG